MKSRDNSDTRAAAAVAKAAADWIARCDRGLTPAEAEEFARWENADPRHPAELARLVLTWNALNTADEIPEVMLLARVVEDKPKRQKAGRFYALAAGLGMAAAIATVAWLGLRDHPARKSIPGLEAAGSASYKVVASTARRLTLADGTTVELNGDSAVEPSFTADKRLVRLIRGEANFNVVKDSTRPFVVQANNVAVQAVGTAFNVRLDPASVHVLVTEGRVRVDDVAGGKSLLSVAMNQAPVDPNSPHAEDALMPFPLLGAGERVVIPAASSAPVEPSAVTAIDLDRATAWQATSLIFDRTSLKDAVAAFNSFNQRQLILGDPALGHRTLLGTFRADNVDAFIWVLEKGFEIKAENAGHGQIILRAAR